MNYVFGATGNDTLTGTGSDDWLDDIDIRGAGSYGADERQVVRGGDGNDTVTVKASATLNVFGDGGDDYLYVADSTTDPDTSRLGRFDGGAGNDTIIVNATVAGQWFHLIGGDGRDSIRGSVGADVIDGGLHADTLAGGGGNDVYYAAGNDTIVEGLNWGNRQDHCARQPDDGRQYRDRRDCRWRGYHGDR